MKDVKVSKNIAQISCDYFENNQICNQPDFTFLISRCHGSDLIFTKDEIDNMSVYEKVMVGNSEVLYHTTDDNKNVTWINDGYYFSVSSTNGNALRWVRFLYQI